MFTFTDFAENWIKWDRQSKRKRRLTNKV